MIREPDDAPDGNANEGGTIVVLMSGWSGYEVHGGVLERIGKMGIRATLAVMLACFTEP